MKVAQPPFVTLDGKHAAPQRVIEMAIPATMTIGMAEPCVRVFMVSRT
jgi:hypothetical protein